MAEKLDQEALDLATAASAVDGIRQGQEDLAKGRTNRPERSSKSVETNTE
jgi:hypothetical protein